MSKSITIRPRNYSHEYYNIVRSWLIKQKKDYIICEELDNHLQIGIKTEQRSDSLRRAIIKLLEFTAEDDDEHNHWLKITSHNDWNYLVGYCAKTYDEAEYIDYKLNEAIEAYILYYNEKKDSITTTKEKWMCTGLNQLLPSAFEFCKEHKLIEFRHGEHRIPELRSIMIKMVAMDKIPFSLGRKINQFDNDFWECYVQQKLFGACMVSKKVSSVVFDVELE